MSAKKFRYALVAAVLIAAAGCQSASPPRPVQQVISYAHAEPIRLNVASLEVVNEYVPPLREPNVEHEFPVRIGATIERWARERLQPVGSGGMARVVIRDASAVETDLRPTPGLRGAFTTDQAQRYDARAEVVVEIRSDRGLREAFATAAVQRSRSVPENITLNDREQVYFEIVEALVKDLDAELERNMRAFMPLYLR